MKFEVRIPVVNFFQSSLKIEIFISIVLYKEILKFNIGLRAVHI